MSGERVVTSQLRPGDLSSVPLETILSKITVANELAGVTRILYLPADDRATDDAILAHCRELGLEVYLWYKVLADNDIVPDESELCQNAWGGNSRTGGSGRWKRPADCEDEYRFGCPRNLKYNNILLSRCRTTLPEYDGLFVDTLGFPLPSLGLDSVFSCFCPVCCHDEPRLIQWRKNVVAMKEAAASTSDKDLERWGTTGQVLKEFDLVDFFHFRQRSIVDLTARYSRLARSMGKPFAIDLLCPALSYMGGHDYTNQGALADWVKPRMYWRVFGPSSISLEFYSLTMGLLDWGKGYSIPGMLNYIGRSTGIPMPDSVHKLSQDWLSEQVLKNEIDRATAMTDRPLHLGMECSIHPDFDTGVTEQSIRTFLDIAHGCTGLVLSWNLAHIPTTYLELIGQY